MRQKKIRGHNRRQKQIDHWRLDNLSLDLTEYLLNISDRYYTKISIHPWNGLSITNSAIPQPKGKTKQKMLNGLLDIYVDWKTKLDKLGQPYYLKIWLFEPRFSQSQVVCAIGENVNFYKNTFDEPGVVNAIQLEHYGTLNAKLSKVRWNCCLDEDHYFNNEVGKPEDYASKVDYEHMVHWFEKLLKKPHRTHKLTEPISEMTESYSFKRGFVWLGGE